MNKQKTLFILFSWGLFLSIAQSQRPLPKDLGGVGTTVGVPEPVIKWDFKQSEHEIVGDLSGHLIGDAKIENGKLCLPCEGSYYKTDPIPFKLTEKTMVAQVYLDNLEQRGGGLITVQSINGVTFDAIVYGEGKPKTWNNGSEHGIRIRGVEGTEETASSGQPIWMGITYFKDGKICLYKNGSPYRTIIQPETPLQHYRKKQSNVLLGKRHEGGANAYLKCKIEFAQIYDSALSEKQMAALYKLQKEKSAQDTKSVSATRPEELPSQLLVITHESYSDSLVKKAEKGDAQAQVDLGYNYHFGKGVTKSDEQANYWYAKAADQGNANAQNNLASNVSSGVGIEKNLSKALELYKKSANQNFAPAQEGLALMLCRGDGVQKNRAEAFQWHLKAARNGWYPSFCRVAFHYKNGIGTSPDAYLATQWQQLSDSKKTEWEGGALVVDEININPVATSNMNNPQTKKTSAIKRRVIPIPKINDYTSTLSHASNPQPAINPQQNP